MEFESDMTQGLLICTDLDRTLIPNGPQPESPQARERFATLCRRPEVTLAYVSGRHRALIEQAIANYCLPTPDYVIADVGTTIYHVSGPSPWHQDRRWDDEIASDWRQQSHAELNAILADLSALRLQETIKQNRHKLSYYVPMHSDRNALSDTIQQRLEEKGIAARLIWSDDEPAGVGLLDITPRRASKYHAIDALLRHLDFPLANTVFAGDSGNDLEVLCSAIPSVLVGNSQESIRQRATAGATRNGHQDRLYIAHGGFLGMNGHYAAGILEGIAHYHPFAIDWMTTANGSNRA